GIVAVVVLPRQHRGRVRRPPHALKDLEHCAASTARALLRRRRECDPPTLAAFAAALPPRGREPCKPREDFAIPELRVPRLKDPVILIGKIDEARRDFSR